MSSWREALDQRIGGEAPREVGGRASANEPVQDIAAAPDPEEYKPWILRAGITC